LEGLEDEKKRKNQPFSVPVELMNDKWKGKRRPSLFLSISLIAMETASSPRGAKVAASMMTAVGREDRQSERYPMQI
jgi:hypothetical protein